MDAEILCILCLLKYIYMYKYIYNYSFIAGSLILHPLNATQAEEYRDWNLMLLRHTMKVINIYNCLFTNQKPLTAMAKGQSVSKMELFGGSSNIHNNIGNTASSNSFNGSSSSSSKDFANSNSLGQIGHFGNELIYWKLYQTLKCAYDNYRVSINHHPAKEESAASPTLPLFSFYYPYYPYYFYYKSL